MGYSKITGTPPKDKHIFEVKNLGIPRHKF